MDIQRYVNAYRKARASGKYLSYLKKPLDEHSILLEAGQGKNINGNIFAFLRVINTDSKYEKYTPYVTVTEGNRKSVDEVLNKRGVKKYKLIVRDSDEYMRVLASAAYLITDNSFPMYFIKRDGQKYLNTWHGTPLKCLGRSDIDHSSSIGNVQKNFLSADYLLQPNEYTYRNMMQDYMVDKVYKNKVILTDYPRNDFLFSSELRSTIRSKFAPNGERLLAYMPTWRGSGRTASVDEQVRLTKIAIELISANIAETDLLYVNLHFLIGNNIDISSYPNVRLFPDEYETYEFLSACDTLISDYSSVMMDFAETGREIIMYMYDYDDYFENKGFYFDIRTLPFKKAFNPDELKETLGSEFYGYELSDMFVGNNQGLNSKLVLDYMVFGDGDSLDIRDNQTDLPSIYYVGNLEYAAPRIITNRLINDMPEEMRSKTVIMFEGEMKKNSIDFLKSLPQEVEYLRCIEGGAISIAEYAFLNANRNLGLFKNRASHYSEREYTRLFRDIRCDSFNFVNSELFERIGEITHSDGRTIFHLIPPFFYRRINDSYYKNPEELESLIAMYDECVNYPDNYSLSSLRDEICEGVQVIFTQFRQHVSDDKLIFNGKMRINSSMRIDSIPDYIDLGSQFHTETKRCALSVDLKNENCRHNVYGYEYDFVITANVDDTAAWYTKNMILVPIIVDGIQIYAPAMHDKKSFLYKTHVADLGYERKVCEIERSMRFFRIIIRERNVTDGLYQRLKINLAFIAHILTPWYKPIILYEKNCNGYEESASVLYERLIDANRDDVFFVLNKKYPFKAKIDKKYLSNIINQFSFKHYYTLFSSKSIISSEALGHALETRTTSSLFKTFVLNGSKNYVFLQHGVMYMVSLDAEQRAFFQKGTGKGKQRVVVSSELEAKHFTDYTNYTRNDIYVSGLLKYDRSVMNHDADTITVMITWRPWEFVEGAHDIKNTGYYRTLKDIVSNIPDSLKEKLLVLPHPLVVRQFKSDTDDPVLKYCITDFSYDEVLKDTKLLITDYSSISYDAFYRGANVIFYWHDLDSCIKEYGENAHLMITEDTAFGPVCYNSAEIKKTITGLYDRIQDGAYVERYRKIVSFHDDNNTNRFIEMAKKDDII